MSTCYVIKKNDPDFFLHSRVGRGNLELRYSNFRDISRWSLSGGTQRRALSYPERVNENNFLPQMGMRAVWELNLQPSCLHSDTISLCLDKWVLIYIKILISEYLKVPVCATSCVIDSGESSVPNANTEGLVYVE